ncbi:hypothetical protein EJB05_34264 [Eragrostis curvula]|uniref:Uncharacterized protein n=1 Tax=Eragrostis curvula TaxID=38414 RepID=A0A5J9U3Q4_9POAL|nr:hypothetical protein EJB05_34264 [Eragrostis curvula]
MVEEPAVVKAHIASSIYCYKIAAQARTLQAGELLGEGVPSTNQLKKSRCKKVNKEPAEMARDTFHSIFLFRLCHFACAVDFYDSCCKNSEEFGSQNFKIASKYDYWYLWNKKISSFYVLCS